MVMQGLSTSIIGRAKDRGLLSIEAVNIRDYTLERHKKVDDYPYGGGAGMLMQAQPVYDAWKSVVDRIGYKPRTVYLTPQGPTFTQPMAKDLAQEKDLILLCGHYEGIDERVLEEIVTDYVSIADRDTGEQKGRNFREIFIEFPLFNKTEAECKTPLDYWLYNLKHMEQLEHLSFKGQKALFNRLEELARIANMNKKERAEYEAALKIYRDNENVMDYAVKTAEKKGLEKGIAIGEERGRAEGILITARLMKQNGISFEQIKLCTGLSDEEIENL